MTTILILEGNTPDMVRQGKSDATPFVTTFMALEPALRLRLGNPYACPIGRGDLDGVDGVVFTGSGVDWAADAAQAAPLRDAMRQVFDLGLPVWGSCNGMQLAATVLGGAVGASPHGVERGVALGITLTDAGLAHPMMAGKSTGFGAPCVHRDEVQRLPEGAVLLAGNAHSPVQAFAYAREGVDFWGVQYHPECSARDMAGWLRPRGAETAEMVHDLEQAETCDVAAARLGTSGAELTLGQRARELSNWLGHVAARSNHA